MDQPVTLYVCVNRRWGGDRPSCAASGSEALATALEQRIQERGIACRLERSPCQGRCSTGPAMRVLPDLEIFLQVGPGDLEMVLDRVADRITPLDSAPTDNIPPPI